MKILLTGASGFLGSAVAHELAAHEHAIYAFLTSESDTRRIENLDIEIVRSKVGYDFSQFGDYFSEIDPDCVIACGWQGVDSVSRNDPKQYENINFLCTLFRVIQDSTEGRCRNFIAFGSQAEYAHSKSPLDEHAITAPSSYYGVAKLAAYTMLERMSAFEQTRFCWVSPFSLYGPDDDPAHMLPYLIETILDGKSPNLSACTQHWDYLHVSDAAQAIVSLAEHKTAHGRFNLGSGAAPRLRDTVDLVRDLLRRPDGKLPSVNISVQPLGPDQPSHLCANVSKLVGATNWSPQISLEEGLEDLVNWHVARRHSDFGAYSVDPEESAGPPSSRNLNKG